MWQIKDWMVQRPKCYDKYNKDEETDLKESMYISNTFLSLKKNKKNAD